MKKVRQILFINFISFVLFAQSNPEIITFTKNNSPLPSNGIYCIVIDNNNVKWIGTDKGLARFDGNNWAIFNTNNGLLSNKVVAAAVDKSNNLWIIDSVLSKYDGRIWTHYTNDKYINASINSLTLAIDENNVKWMTTENQWRNVCSFNDTVFTVYDWGKTTNEIRSVWNIKTFKNEKWIADYSALWKYDNNKLIFMNRDTLSNLIISGQITAFNISPVGNVFVSTYYWLGNPESGIIDYYNRYESVKSKNFYRIEGLPEGISFAIAYENDSTKWLGINYSLYRLTNGHISSFRYGFVLSDLGIIVIDKLSNKWLASDYNSHSNGVSVYKEGGVILSSARYTADYLPSNYKLGQNYPNPFNPTTTIKFSIPGSSFVTLKVYDMLGREITSLVNEEKSPGIYTVKFDGSTLASGIYFYHLHAGNYTETKKFILMK